MKDTYFVELAAWMVEHLTFGPTNEALPVTCRKSFTSGALQPGTGVRF